MKHEIWNVAFRKRIGDKHILDDIERSFQVIPNTWRYWCADPHLFEFEGNTYIFAELYDRVLRRGVIGYCTIQNKQVSTWKVALKRPFHLSYPHIFVEDGKIYMIPESYVGNEIGLYVAEKFPDKWKKINNLKFNYIAVDSTKFSIDGNQWLLTLQFEDGHENLQLFTIKENNLGIETTVFKDDSNRRPAGKLFEWNGKLIRPAQDCTKGYGCALNFYEVLDISVDKYEETLIKKIKPEEIKSNFREIPQGIHTYNQNESYEVIDLKSYEFDWLFYVMRPIWFIWRRVRKVFK